MLCVFSLSSCGTFRAYEKSAIGSQSIFEDARDESSIETQNDKNEFTQRKIVYSAYMDMEVKEPDSIAVKVNQIAKKYDGYVSTTGTQQVIIRIPSPSFENAMSDVASLGEIENKVVKGQDVTEEFLDLEIRLDNAEKARLRYLELLEKAANVSEALEVEKELERLVKEIDLLKGKMNRLANLTSFATIKVNFIDLEEVPKPGPIGYVFVGLYKGIKWLFVRN